jgi:long-chain acyl-CoA synthetase
MLARGQTAASGGWQECIWDLIDGEPAVGEGLSEMPDSRNTLVADAWTSTGGRDPSLGAMALRAAATYPGVALRFSRDGAWRELRYGHFGAAVSEIAAGLIALGIERGDRVAVLSDTRPEWTLADCGALCAGAVVVPIYQTNSPEECRYVLQHSGARLVFCEDQEQLAKVDQVRGECARLENVIAFTGGAGRAMSVDDLRQRAAEADFQTLEARVQATRPDDTATIIYTSGTTGPPKGCVLTHANVLVTVRMYADALGIGREPFSIFMFLPLAHALARVAQMVALDRGGTIAYWRRDPKLLLDDLAETAPTHFPSVPRVFEKIHARAFAGAESAPRRGLLRWALHVGAAVRERERAGLRPGALLRARQALADRLVLSKVRRLFGGRLRMALTGAAPIGRQVLDFFDACGVPVLEGYGLTETCAAATLNTPADLRFGTVGRPLSGVELAIADDGEVLIRGDHVFAGYYKDDPASDEALTNGWLRSGDLGSVDGDGYLTITGRKKDIIITSSGKNVAPTNIETALRERPWISQAVVYGDNRPYLVALLTLDRDEAAALAERLGVSAKPARMAQDERVREALQAEVDEVNKRFARVEQIKRFAVLDRDLTQAAGELTPTMKVKRAVVYDRYGDTLERLYA